MTSYKIVFVGPCAKINRKTGRPFPPFHPDSRSGGFLRRILCSAGLPATVCLAFDNIISGPVFDSHGRERNPTVAELSEAVVARKDLFCGGVDVVVGLSAAVRAALEGYNQSKSRSSPKLLFLEHPSFIMRRPQSERLSYERRLRRSIRAVIETQRADQL